MKSNNTSHFEIKKHVRQKVNIVMNMTIARQRFGKYIPEIKQSTVEGSPLLGNKSLGTIHSNGQSTNNDTRTVRGGGFFSVRPE